MTKQQNHNEMSVHSTYWTWTEEEKVAHDTICDMLQLGPDGERELTDIKHIHQEDTWDCGLTCIQMILKTTELECYALRGQKWMRELVGTKSIWTIDLVQLLHYTLERIKVKNLTYIFCSTKFGVDENYNTLDYYEDAFQDDLHRVERLFALAAEKQFPLLQAHLSLRVLVDFVSRKNCIAIALIDNRILRGRELDGGDQYSGHYVIVCGVSYDSNDVSYAKTQCLNASADDEFCFVTVNPGVWKEKEFVLAKRFDAAWRANGTDEDIILINLQ